MSGSTLVTATYYSTPIVTDPPLAIIVSSTKTYIKDTSQYSTIYSDRIREFTHSFDSCVSSPFTIKNIQLTNVSPTNGFINANTLLTFQSCPPFTLNDALPSLAISDITVTVTDTAKGCTASTLPYPLKINDLF